MSELPLIPLSGSPIERGRQHGKALSEEIAANIALYSARMRHDAGLSDADIAERVGLYRDVFATLDPDYFATMEGIAAGSGQTLPDIVMLNARFELLYSAWSAAGVEMDVDECTAFAAGREFSDDGKLRIGQNWDWFPKVRGGLLAWRDGDLTVLAYTEAGIAGAKIGLNSAGIGLCVNGLSSNYDDYRRGGLPYHLRTSRILASTTLLEAVAHASLDAPSCSANFLIGSSADGVVDVESSPAGSRRIEPKADEVLVHANHFVEPEILDIIQSFHTQPVTTFHRAQRLTELLEQHKPLAEADIISALRDHHGDILAVCRHPSPDKPEHLRIHTAFTAVMDLDEGLLHYSDGPPCEAELTTIRLSDVAAQLN